MNTGGVREVLMAIDGQAVVDDLLELAEIGGEKLPSTGDHPYHVSPTRLALTEADTEARETFVKPRMQAAGMDVMDDHPLALIGTYPGRDPELDPVVIMSHTDTVPQADMYDGTLGVVGGLHVVRAMREHDVQPERDVMLVSLSGEESSRFGIALFGSRALFHGLSGAELAMRKDSDQSVREALGPQGVDWVSKPVFGPNGFDLPTPRAVIELHVEQGKLLEESGLDLGVVDRIAAPVRYRAAVGETPLPVDWHTYAHERYFRLDVHGRADHSGSTPMGAEHRADGLLETAHLLDELLEDQHDPVLQIGAIDAKKGAMNKVPGETRTMLRIVADDARSVEESYQQLQTKITELTGYHRIMPSSFPSEPFGLEEINREAAGTFYEPEEMASRQRAAFGLIKSVNLAAKEGAWDDHVVGTVASLASTDGIIAMEVDIRGADLAPRSSVVEAVHASLKTPVMRQVQLGAELPGSGTPVSLDQVLADQALNMIAKEFGIGSARLMTSAAGHDTQNAARAGVPSVMLFCESKGGIAHNPDAYTSTSNIKKGVQALAALTLRVADERY